ncbi:hypothetical protein P4U23_02005 [Aeribacillus composti]|uniref:hypothetical protein n=1 Tax=Aeribacillus composti TaxID=1868734 RepID=UPI002E1D7333|nr:hypothetical protein [Aeribacillus composti]
MVVGTLRYPAFDDEELSEKVECKPFNSIVEVKEFFQISLLGEEEIFLDKEATFKIKQIIVITIFYVRWSRK